MTRHLSCVMHCMSSEAAPFHLLQLHLGLKQPAPKDCSPNRDWLHCRDILETTLLNRPVSREASFLELLSAILWQLIKRKMSATLLWCDLERLNMKNEIMFLLISFYVAHAPRLILKMRKAEWQKGGNLHYWVFGILHKDVIHRRWRISTETRTNHNYDIKLLDEKGRLFFYFFVMLYFKLFRPLKH